MPVWVQLARPKSLNLDGVRKDHYPGDWVKVGKHMAEAWIAAGDAVMPYPQNMRVEEPAGTAGVHVFWGSASYDDMNVEWQSDSKWELTWEKTGFYDIRASVQKYLFPVAFNFLTKWQVVAPLWDYRELAIGEGTEEDRERTRAVIRDLRVPMYDTRLIFMRRCPETRAVLELWDAESSGQMDKLAFLRAIYRVKPLLLALPVTWSGQWAPTTA
jgi:hypothetical protein